MNETTNATLGEESQEVQANTQAPSVVREKIILGKFGGQNSAFGRGFYYELVAARFDKRIAHKVAMDCLSDLGDAMARNSELTANVQKAKKKGEESGFKLPKASMSAGQITNAMRIVRVAQILRDVVKEKLVVKSPDMSTIEWPMEGTYPVTEYLENCEKWCNEREFVSGSL